MSKGPGTTRPTSDAKLPENTKESPDRKLDHAIEETFPTSDPVSVVITKGGAIDHSGDQAVSSASPDRSRPEGQGGAESLVGQTKEALQSAAQSTTEAARDAYDQGRRYVDQARERYPEAERTVREGSRMVRQQAADHPVLTLLLGVGIGYALAWVIQNRGSSHNEQVPDYARTRQRYMLRD